MNNSESQEMLEGLEHELPDSLPEKPTGINRGLAFVKKQQKKLAAILLIVVVIIVGVLIIIALAIFFGGKSKESCVKRPAEMYDDDEVVYPSGNLLLKNVNILDGNLEGYDIFIQNGIIQKIGKGIVDYPSSTDVMNFDGDIITPGLIDVHSHLGVYSFPEVWAREDGNEMTNPSTPQVRAIDGFYPSDPAIQQTLEGSGVTTAQILPGSGNAQGGETFFIKLHPSSVSVEDFRLKKAPFGLKHALGENPKRVYGRRQELPMSRMGTAWVFRKKFSEAKALMERQDYWDCNLSHQRPLHERPEDLSLHGLVRLLRGEAILNVHGYEVEDLEMMIRVSKEFGFQIAGFHHALEAWKIPNILANHSITVATFADEFGFKQEAYDSSVHAGKILAAHGVNVVYKSDHPVTHSKDLIGHAARAHYYGLDADIAMNSLTRNAAKMVKLDHRIGEIKEGLEADLVTWDRHPLDLGARPRNIFIAGDRVKDLNRELKSTDMNPKRNLKTMEHSLVSDQFHDLFTGYAIRNVDIFTKESLIPNGMVVVSSDGIITCVDSTENCEASVSPQMKEFEYPGGKLTPGFVETTTDLGLREVSSEGSTKDGESSSEKVQAKDGIKMKSRPMTAAFKAGVLTSITAPNFSGTIGGEAVGFTTTSDFVDDGLIETNQTIVYVRIGNDAKKAGVEGSISGQIAKLRNSVGPNKIYVCEIYDADSMNAVLRLHREKPFNLIFMGAAEAHLVADKLRKQNVPVILTPGVKHPLQSYETRFTNDGYYADKLFKAGVDVALGSGNTFYVRHLRWIAGLASDAGIPFEDALKMITSNPASFFKAEDGVGDILLHTKANFVLFNGNPLTYEGRIVLLATGNRVMLNPVQF